ncbi:Pheromone-regulated membrane protein 10 [Mycena venus]|uniref:Pheromone-regulated membrane protein 10 n=1 Tax=Mycena venus TaxID=2733690 RepID=A0A8H6Y247_9AGAR|nr:Pheromone-regulated membrane protein 10 [Mycena venus]
MSVTLRKATIADAPSLSHICLVTADAGKSAEALHDFGELPGLVYAVPYVNLPTTWAFVLVDGSKDDLVVGYIVGSTDTRAYEKSAAKNWWPVQAEKYLPSAMVREGDKRYADLLRNMHTAPDANIAFSPAHMHINILEEYRGQGWGRRMIQTAVDYLKEQGINRLWLGMDPRNTEARKFYERLGFTGFEGSSPTDTETRLEPNKQRVNMSSSYNDDDFTTPRRPSASYLQPTSMSPAVGSSTRQDTRSGDLHPQPRPPASQQTTLRSGSVQWNIPIYTENGTRRADDIESVEEFPRRRPSSLILPPDPESRRGSGDNSTLCEVDESKKYSFSSYEHPYDITPPRNAYSGAPAQHSSLRSALRRSVSFAEDPPNVVEYDEEAQIDAASERALKRRGVLSNMMDLYALEHDLNASTGRRRDSQDPNDDLKEPQRYTARQNIRRMDSMASDNSDVLDPDDPRVTGITARNLEDPADIDKNVLRLMDYKSRRKHLMRAKIEFNVTSMINRQDFLLKLARALMTFGAPSHRIESQLTAAARILEVEAEFIHLPGVIICSFGDQELGCSETHFIKCGGRLSLGALHEVHVIYRSVVHDEISAKTAAERLENLLNAPPPYSILTRCMLAFCLSALICPLAFGGSFLDMWVAGGGAFILSVLQLCAATKSAIYANVFEITIAIFVSFTARGLSSIRSQVFCYTAISSAGIIGILPGYLILSSSLELASKNIVCGSVKMVYALIYTLFLGFGLQIGSDFYLLLDSTARRKLVDLAATLSTVATLSGTWAADNDTLNSGIPANGTWTFLHFPEPHTADIIEGCYRPRAFQVVAPAVPGLELPVMVVISCCSYATNKVANHYIFNRSDVVSAIGAFTIGLLGNIYSRKMGGTAFTSMVTGVLFLVPSGLSQAGGITANGNGIDIGGAMIAVTIGITVGLFMSQALVYMFGTRKNAAVFSF